MGNTTENFGLLAHTIPKSGAHLRFPLSLFFAAAVGNRGGVDSDGVLIGNYTETAVGQAFTDDGGVFVDVTGDLNDAGADDVLIYPAVEAIGDAFYMGDDVLFGGVRIDMGVVGVGVTAIQAWEYWNGAAWTTVVNLLDSTVAGGDTFGQDGFVTFAVPSDWVKNEVDGNNRYWIRARMLVVYATTEPIATQGFLLRLNSGIGVQSPVTGYLTDIGITAETVSGAGDSVFNVVNLRRGTGAFFTLAGALKTENVVMNQQLYFEKGDEILIQMVAEDGTTEYADMNMVLYFRA